VSNSVELAVPVWLCLPRTFSSDTELGIRTASPVRRNLNKERPYELLIAVALPSAAQHPFKLQIPFKSNTLCRPLSCGSLSIAALQEKGSNGMFQKEKPIRGCTVYSAVPGPPHC